MVALNIQRFRSEGRVSNQFARPPWHFFQLNAISPMHYNTIALSQWQR